MSIIVRVKNKIQFEEALRFARVDQLIADFGCASLDIENIRKEHPEKKIYLQLPDVLREKKAESVKKIAEKAFLFDGIVIKNFDELGLLLELVNGEQKLSDDFQVIGDSFLYAYNLSAISFYRGFFPQMKFILPDELTDRENAKLMAEAEKECGVPSEDFIYQLYGYQPLMITNQCLNRNYAGCEKPLLRFEDEQKRQFFITSECGQCYDIIYNGQPTVMMDKMSETDEGFEIDGIVYPNIMFDFTIEPKEEIARILSGTPEGENELVSNFTRGHHYKGVE